MEALGRGMAVDKASWVRCDGGIAHRESPSQRCYLRLQGVQRAGSKSNGRVRSCCVVGSDLGISFGEIQSSYFMEDSAGNPRR
jgi:hypothetical protein